MGEMKSGFDKIIT